MCDQPIPQNVDSGREIASALHRTPRVLVVAPEPVLAFTRAALVRAAGFTCRVAHDAGSAIALLHNEEFDLVLLGYDKHDPQVPLEKRLQEAFPGLLILKIDGAASFAGTYATRTIGNHPAAVIHALHAMLGNFNSAKNH